MSCIACQCAYEDRSPDVAFLAGAAFAASFNVEAMKARLCIRHKAMLLEGTVRAQTAVKPAERRR
jgi:hypothetical protein